MTANAPPFTPRTGPLRHLFAALHARGYPRRYLNFIAPHKTRLLSPLSGTILEIGPGAGANLPFYSPGLHWIGLEPNLHMHPHLNRAAAAHPHLTCTLLPGLAENIPLPTASVDSVVGTLVLCSVTNTPAALQEIRRVLRPGGQYIFIEHVAAKASALCALQHLLAPCSALLGDGCRPTRKTAQAIQSAGFSALTLTHLSAPLAFASPHILGQATR